MNIKETIFVKRNAFTCITFGAFFIFTVYISIIKSADLSILAFIIALFTLGISLLKLVADILEDINDKMTNYIDSEHGSLNDIVWDLKIAFNNNENETVINERISNYCQTEDSLWAKPELEHIYLLLNKRARIRVQRRYWLFFYYSMLMILIILLLLHSEIAPFIKSIFINVDLNLITLWSLIIILFDIMMKDIVEEHIVIKMDKKYGTSIKWY